MIHPQQLNFRVFWKYLKLHNSSRPNSKSLTKYQRFTPSSWKNSNMGIGKLEFVVNFQFLDEKEI